MPRTDVGTAIFGAILLGVLVALVVLLLKGNQAFHDVLAGGTPFSCAESEVDLAASLVDDRAFGALAASFETVDPPISSCDPDSSVGQVDSTYRSPRSAREVRDHASGAILRSGWRSLQPGRCYTKEYGDREVIGILGGRGRRAWFQILVVPADEAPSCG